MGLFDALKFFQNKLKEYNVSYDINENPDGSQTFELNVKGNKIKMKVQPDKMSFDHLSVDWQKLDDPDMEGMLMKVRNMITGDVPADYDFHGITSKGFDCMIGGMSIVGAFCKKSDFDKVNDDIQHYVIQNRLDFEPAETNLNNTSLEDITVADTSNIWEKYLEKYVKCHELKIGPHIITTIIFSLDISAKTWNNLMKSFHRKEECAQYLISSMDIYCQKHIDMDEYVPVPYIASIIASSNFEEQRYSIAESVFDNNADVFEDDDVVSEVFERGINAECYIKSK